jgi:hypothetical protein
MDAKFIREYFLAKYELRFHQRYLTRSTSADFAMLNRIKTKYGEDVTLEAIDNFLSVIPFNKATINFFSTGSVFESLFNVLIKLSPIIRYRRLLSKYSPELHAKMKSLIDEYTDYTLAMYPSTEELIRKTIILKELETLDAERFRSSIN